LTLRVVRETVRAKDLPHGLIVEILVLNAKESNHPGETACYVCAPAKPEEEDIVARIPNIRKKSVAVLNFLKEAVSHRAAMTAAWEQMAFPLNTISTEKNRPPRVDRSSERLRPGVIHRSRAVYSKYHQHTK
jgi:hypothetical protein